MQTISATTTANTVCIIGLGNMGLGMAKRLIHQGFVVHGCDPEPSAAVAAQAAGVVMHPRPDLAALSSQVIVLAVVNAAQIDAVLAQMLSGLKPHQTVLLMSTIAPQDAARLVALIETTGAQALDCPMSGGPARAAAGELSLMMAGSAAAMQAVHSVTNCLATQHFVLSHIAGDAAKAKLLNNLLAGIHLVAGAHMLAAAQALGLNTTTFLALTQASSGQSWIAGDRLPRALSGDEQPRSYMHILTKDVTLANQLLRANDIESGMGQQAQNAFEAAIQAGLSLADDSAVFAMATRALNNQAPKN